MYGNGIGTLRVLQVGGSPGSDPSTEELWSLTGEAGNSWYQGQLSVASSSPFRV